VRNLFVRFKVCDVYIPEPQEVLNELYGNSLLQGEVIDLTDSGAQEKVYAVVKVDEVKNVLIVPMDKVIVVGSNE
jgi:hypothetical protein